MNKECGLNLIKPKFIDSGLIPKQKSGTKKIV
jgi:hypothetical protein